MCKKLIKNSLQIKNSASHMASNIHESLYSTTCILMLIFFVFVLFVTQDLSVDDAFVKELRQMGERLMKEERADQKNSIRQRTNDISAR